MPLNLGWTTLEDDTAAVVYSFQSLIDYDPASSNLRDAVGDHYDILRTNGGTFLLRYRIRGQESFGSPAFTAAEGFFPIPADVAYLLMGRDTSPARVPQQTEKPFDQIVLELEEWLSSLTPAVKDRCETANDLLHDLRELILCLNVQAYRGCLAMAGVVLERAIKQTLTTHGIAFAKDWMVGKLISLLTDAQVYIDPSLKNIWNIINAQRIIGVHATEATPIPSRDQALMVTFAIKDTVTRTFADEPSGEPEPPTTPVLKS